MAHKICHLKSCVNVNDPSLMLSTQLNTVNCFWECYPDPSLTTLAPKLNLFYIRTLVFENVGERHVKDKYSHLSIKRTYVATKQKGLLFGYGLK